MIREIVLIDEEKCDGCGQCVPACHEGAIQIQNGKAKLIAENLCDGLGACLGHCPQGAIRVERREANAFDEHAVQARLAPAPLPPPLPHHAGGCPSQRFVRLGSAAPTASEPEACGLSNHGTSSFSEPEPHLSGEARRAKSEARDLHAGSARSQLAQWPVQLKLLPPRAPVFQNADLLLTADCVPFAMADYHDLLRGHAVAIACPKLDDTSTYVAKLTEIIAANNLRSITVAHMEVPCCTGILMMALEARANAGVDVPIEDITVGTRGEIRQRRQIPTALTH